MIRCLYGDDIGAEIRTQQQTEGFDSVGSLWFASGQAELCELLIWLQHDHVGPKDNTGLLLFVVIDLYGSIVGNSEGDHFGLITLVPSTRSSCGACDSDMMVM